VRLMIPWIMLTASCATTATSVVYVAPSARHLSLEIRAAAARLNDAVDGEVFEVRLSDSERLPEGAIVVRGASRLGCSEYGCYVGTCTRTEDGAVIRLMPSARTIHVAHEMLHALGLRHVEDPANIMARAPYSWAMTSEQKRKVLEYE
jgi:hypothetical protein